jgi:hypothetical protein
MAEPQPVRLTSAVTTGFKLMVGMMLPALVIALIGFVFALVFGKKTQSSSERPPTPPGTPATFTTKIATSLPQYNNAGTFRQAELPGYLAINPYTTKGRVGMATIPK